MNYKKQIDYIPYFANDKTEFCKWISGYPNYDDRLGDFINSIYETDLLKKDYLDDINGKITDKDIIKAIPTSNFELLKSILTYYVRQERFCDGIWAMAAKEKVFLKILYRLREIVGQ
ncbi:DUF6508 domain-containing protein [Neobacillus novalis]|uniref:DUF6508 domain-containing protein n=1 Tax=Neobacillus novalis TaxID=220687 RepID=A0AA95MNM4_9BACI|nr:DUF6508 domain-containing protein [Neobacillus novalis]WHY87046.1 DUF6508 domain-containing protein [Neobacillus novalis]